MIGSNFQEMYMVSGMIPFQMSYEVNNELKHNSH